MFCALYRPDQTSSRLQKERYTPPQFHVWLPRCRSTALGFIVIIVGRLILIMRRIIPGISQAIWAVWAAVKQTGKQQTLQTKRTSSDCGLTRCPSWQELPKSTILMADLLGLQSRMFSGLRSQWMMLSSGVARKSSAVHSCWANLRVRFRDTPRKLVFLSRSYRL